MINRKLLLLLLIFIIHLSETFAQKLIFTGDFQLIGYDNTEPVFRIIHQEENKYSLFKFDKEKTYDIYGFYEFKSNSFPASEIEFIHNDVLLRRFKFNGVFQNIIYYNTNDSLEIRNWSVENSIYLDTASTLLVFLRNEEDYLTIEIDFANSTPEIQYLPIKADKAFVIDDWLYFSFFHEQYEYSPWPHDIFRVKIDDWLNPELVFEGSEYNEWFLYPENHIIGTDIALDKIIEVNNKENEILFNVEKQSYAVIPDMSQNIIYYNDKYYNYFKKRDDSRGIETIGLKPLPDLPSEYPYQKYQVLPREVWYNLPLEEKVFSNTFITPYLLREAPRSDLLKLEQAQLRLLRNALYAQYGYVFQSTDLQEFFNQYEWYQMMTVKRKDNKDIILMPKDKERAQLILEIENGK